MPEPGDRPPAPGSLRLVQAFLNTVDLEDADDVLGTPAQLGRWLAEVGLLPAAARPGRSDHARALELREAIRELAAGHTGLPHDPAAAELVNAAADRARLRPVLGADGASALEPHAGGVDGALGRIVAAIHAAAAEGTWPRLKACERDVCRWAFYDHSKNRAGRWCSMDVCGSREKSRRAYRRRRGRRSP